MAVVDIGARVHYVLPDGNHRPATVVAVWSQTCVNLAVQVDGSNDEAYVRQKVGALAADNPLVGVVDAARRLAHFGLIQTVWETSRNYDAAGTPGTWHWPELG